jgi:phenylacetate-coenzyme A ligase PaaK-like adenylate-forming protein
MLVTVFHNPWFAVLRFDIGDVARLDDRGPCPCGRTEGLTLASIDGRTKDVTFAPDGRAITVDELDRALAGVLTLAGWQLDLPEPARLHLRILADPGTETQTRRAALELMEGIYGPDMQIEVTVVPSLQHEPSGKFRFARAAFSVNHERLWGETPPLDL